MSEWYAIVLGYGAISALALGAANSIQKTEVPKGRYAERVLLFSLSVIMLPIIAWVLAQIAKNTPSLVFITAFSTVFFIIMLLVSFALVSLYILYVTEVMFKAAQSTQQKKDDEEGFKAPLRRRRFRG